jgi:predicted amidophosphoribosyltransferase
VKFLRSFLEVVFPPVCAACGVPGREPFCELCKEALEPAPPFEIPGADQAGALWLHGGPAALAVQHLKFHDHPELGRPLGEAMQVVLPEFGPIDLAVPVPCSPGRLRDRGYNQARELLRGLGLPVKVRALSRTKEVPPQVGLDRAGRLENLVGAIGLGPEAQALAGRRVLLVDDVITTGATAQAAAAALRAGGAGAVLVLALTRAE